MKTNKILWNDVWHSDICVDKINEGNFDYALKRAESHFIAKIHLSVRNAVKSGTLPIKDCEGCGKTKEEERIHAHHCDYRLPFDIMWLCVRCHRKWHTNNTAPRPLTRLENYTELVKMIQRAHLKDNTTESLFFRKYQVKH